MQARRDVGQPALRTTKLESRDMHAGTHRHLDTVQLVLVQHQHPAHVRLGDAVAQHHAPVLLLHGHARLLVHEEQQDGLPRSTAGLIDLDKLLWTRGGMQGSIRPS